MNTTFKRILVIKMRFHGDMLLTTPVIGTLKRNYPEAKIDVLQYQDTIPILSGNPEINASYGISNKGVKTGKKISNFLSLISLLRKNHYDLIVNLTDQWSVAMMVRCLGPAVKISQDYGHRQSSFWKNSFTHLAPVVGDHVVEASLSVLAPLGITDFCTETILFYTPADWRKIRGMLDEQGVRDNYVVIQPTARQQFKCWDNDKFSRVIDFLQDKGFPVVLTSGPGAADLACVNEIAQGCQQPPVVALAGKTSFPELGALIDHAALFIGVDSAPGHIAAAVKTPVISLFGATDHVYWRPWTEQITQFWAGNYQPMPPRAQLDRNKKYMSVIPAEDVIAAVSKMLPATEAEPQTGGTL
ncbi:lipopolysaccharide core heptosyltransferase RfaQ [Cedecea davisae]|uniref:lipopolysaccharide core heptosyltransferase RfaQ n=1 Tax=Cedecea davisae TaxID=158484 RepID=UPI00242C6E43|nr:lipopolysaccharide core heptosyltransferase RfaQ [Cedecea davisae]